MLPPSWPSLKAATEMMCLCISLNFASQVCPEMLLYQPVRPHQIYQSLLLFLQEQYMGLKFYASSAESVVRG
jgi:hypothetical protein